MGAFIVAGIVFIITLAITVLTFFAAMASPTGEGGPNPLLPLGIGLLISAAIAATHWFPNIGW